MKIQNELLTGIINDSQQLKKAGSVRPEVDFAAVLTNELGQAENIALVATSPKEAFPLIGITDSESLGSQNKSAAFSELEIRFMEELDELLNVVDSYTYALSGQGGEAQSGLKSVYSILDGITQKTKELKVALAEIGDNPVLSDIVNELEVMASTEKFKLNRGDYSV